jgi:hypothetical protein
MKAVIILTALAAFAINVNSAPVDQVVSSALMPGDSVMYNLDFVDPFGLPIFDVMVNSRMGNTEYTTTMDHLGTPYYLNTYEGTQSYPNPSGIIEFYGRVEADTLLLTQSYKNDGNQFPPASILYADLADDPAGDTLPGTIGQWLDLTGSAITHSDDRIYARLNNAGGGWPTSQGLNFFAYGFVLYNPGSSDLSATALVYVNVPFFYTPGLYSVNLVDTSFTRIADIQYQTSGDNLHMSCAISDLLLDPNWNQWPPESEYVLTGGLTISVVSLQPNLNDYTYPSAFIPMTQYLVTDQNSAPTIAFDTVVPYPPLTVDATIEYNDNDNNLPVERLFIFDDMSYEMGSSDHYYGDGSFFESSIPWPGPEWHTFYFRYSDGDSIVETELDSIYLTMDGIEDENLPLSFELHQNYPNPFNAQTVIEFQLSEPARVNLAVYDIAGRKVADLAGEDYTSGQHLLTWDGTDNTGKSVSSGIYLYKMKAGDLIETRKMLLMK